MTDGRKKQVLIDYFEATVQTDIDGIASFLADDFTVWLVPSARQHGLPVPLVGRKQFLDLVRGMRDSPGMWKPRAFVPEQFFFDGDSVAVRVRMLGDFASGLEYDNEYVFIYKFVGDKIAEMREFTDTAYINSLMQEAAAQAGPAQGSP